MDAKAEARGLTAPRIREYLTLRGSDISVQRISEDLSFARNIINDVSTRSIRAWLLFYSLPIMLHFLPTKYYENYALLVTGLYILLKNSITEAELQTADDLLKQFVEGYGKLYGRTRVSLNVHTLIHYVNTVREPGPLWAHSCFFFEDVNGQVLRLIHGTQAVEEQGVGNDPLDLTFSNLQSFNSDLANSVQISYRDDSIEASIERHKKTSTFLAEKKKTEQGGKDVFVIVEGQPITICHSLMNGLLAMAGALYAFQLPHSKCIALAMVFIEHHLLKDVKVHQADLGVTFNAKYKKFIESQSKRKKAPEPVVERHFCGPQHRRPHQGSTDHHRVVKAAKAGGQNNKKEIKRFKDIKALHLTLASSPGVGKIIRKMVMTKDEQRFEEEADKVRASLGAPPATHHHVAPGMMYHPAPMLFIMGTPIICVPIINTHIGVAASTPAVFALVNKVADKYKMGEIVGSGHKREVKQGLFDVLQDRPCTVIPRSSADSRDNRGHQNLQVMNIPGENVIIDTLHMTRTTHILLRFATELNMREHIKDQAVVGDQASCKNVRGARGWRLGEDDPVEQLKWVKESPVMNSSPMPPLDTLWLPLPPFWDCQHPKCTTPDAFEKVASDFVSDVVFPGPWTENNDEVRGRARLLLYMGLLYMDVAKLVSAIVEIMQDGRSIAIAIAIGRVAYLFAVDVEKQCHFDMATAVLQEKEQDVPLPFKIHGGKANWRSMKRKPLERKPLERKPLERKPLKRKPLEREPLEREPLERKPLEREPLEREPLERKPLGRKPLERKPLERELLERKPLPQRTTQDGKPSPQRTTQDGKPRYTT
ncbi:Hypp6801 [Branchiostoma lanceolatum]|uniref:Hypp6801 protein n=1 Tax=Branchiostoma lanceolatum TaxID=7740 RepID=A0A8J9YVG4_BRALA|nr:Hypp6801 [Branchiostoma lanceolatum]